MKSHARVVIIGGGSLGISLYHLTHEAWTGSFLVEKSELSSDSSWHAAGPCSIFIGNMAVATIRDYSIKLQEEMLAAEANEASSVHKTGSQRNGHSTLEEESFRNLVSRANCQQSCC